MNSGRRQTSMTSPSSQKMTTGIASTPHSISASSSKSTRRLSQRNISEGAGQFPPVVTRKASQSSGTSTGRRMSQVTRVKQGGVVGGKQRKESTAEGGGVGAVAEDIAGLRQSFQSLMVTKRMARTLRQRTSQRIADRRGVSFVAYTDRPRRRSPSARSLPRAENSYQLEPPERFSTYAHIIHDIIESLVESRLKGMKYDPRRCSKEAEDLADLIKERVKTLDIRRYKLISMVHIGKLRGQGVRVCSRNSWDTSTDSVIDYHFHNDSLFCVAIIYGVYFE